MMIGVDGAQHDNIKYENNKESETSHIALNYNY